jgi:endonuclease YncB( thermonuclease family)
VKLLSSLTAAMLLASSVQSFAQTVVDGDMVKMDGVTYRLWGIDAPESKQLCKAGWPAGVEATKYMRSLLAGHHVTHEDKGKDQYGRTIAKLLADGMDVQAEMVNAGMAWAFTKYSWDYWPNEYRAKFLHKGIHDHDCEPAWNWRVGHRELTRP